MALGIPLSQSRPLLKAANSISPQHVSSSATPILSNLHNVDGQPKKFFSGYLVHPGAVLCLMDLLPAVDYDCVVNQRVAEAPPSATPSTVKRKLRSDFLQVANECTDGDGEIKEEKQMDSVKGKQVSTCLYFFITVK